MTDHKTIGEFKHIYSGKVRDIYENPSGELLFVASDRISAYDWVLPSTIPDKGKILTQLTLWWLEQLEDLVPNHLISLDVPEEVKNRSMIVKKLKMIPVEAVVREYLSGSGWAEYQKNNQVCGNMLPAGLKESSKLPFPIFTPATKAELGDHDENISFERTIEIIGSDLALRLKKEAIKVFTKASEIASKKGILLADTKFEFGMDENNKLTLADEVLTPDSSRYWSLANWQAGQAQNSFDKQFVRDWLTSQASGWDRNSNQPPPELPEEIIEKTKEKYEEIFKIITGKNYVQ